MLHKHWMMQRRNVCRSHLLIIRASIVRTCTNPIGNDVLGLYRSFVFSPYAVDSIELFLNATRERVSEFMFNTTTFIAENDRIISEIDDLIAGLADVHSRVNKVRGPGRRE